MPRPATRTVTTSVCTGVRYYCTYYCLNEVDYGSEMENSSLVFDHYYQYRYWIITVQLSTWLLYALCITVILFVS